MAESAVDPVSLVVLPAIYKQLRPTELLTFLGPKWAFVRTLLKHKSITLTKPKMKKIKGRRAGAKTKSSLPVATHRVQTQGSERVLVRTHFFCGVPLRGMNEYLF